MKKIFFLLTVVTSIFIGCSGGSNDEAPAPEENKAPEVVANLLFPTNNMLCISNTLEFSWSSATDPNGDRVTYILEISQDSQFSTIDQTVNSLNVFKSVTVEKGIIYYWRVKAKDNKGLESGYSSVYQFYTEGDASINHLPFPAQAVNPSKGASLNTASTNLEWDTSDVDNDPLTYDVYFGTANPPVTKVGDAISEKTLSVDLNVSTSYYWKVVAKDDKGGQSIGQIWSFSTE